MADQTPNKPTSIYEMKYDGKNCPICKADKTFVNKMYKGDEADLMCEGCGAIYYALNHFDQEKAGLYTGRTEQPSKANTIALSWPDKDGKFKFVKEPKEGIQ